MSSFDIVNYSLRPNKSIQRSLVFEAVRMSQGNMELMIFFISASDQYGLPIFKSRINFCALMI